MKILNILYPAEPHLSDIATLFRIYKKKLLVDRYILFSKNDTIVMTKNCIKLVNNTHKYFLTD